MSWKDALMREAVRSAKRSSSDIILGRSDYVRDAREEKEKMGKGLLRPRVNRLKMGASLQRRQPTWLRNLVILLLLRGKRRSIIGRLLYFSSLSYSLFG